MSDQSAIAGSYGSGAGNPPPTRPHRRRRRTIIASVIALLLIILLLLFFIPRPTAAVTLTPASKNLNDSWKFTATSRIIHSAPQDSQSGATSGRTKAGIHAYGVLTFKNYTLSWVTIPKGTIVTNINGQQVMTKKALRVPPDPIVPGIASVSAQAVKTGKSGDIPAMSVNKLYSTGVYVLNESAYSGGLDDSTIYSIQQSDIDSLANTLKTALIQKAQSDIQSKLQPGEQLVNTHDPLCSEKVTSKPVVGAITANFTVTVSLACSNSAYNPQPSLVKATDKLKQEADQQLGPGFNLLGTIKTRVEQITPGNDGNAIVLISASGTWKYQFTADIKSNIAQHIARKTVADAKIWLLQQKGVVATSISIKGPVIDLSRGNIVPDDIRAITING